MNQELLNQFLSLLEASSSFKLLSPEQQALLRKAYLDASDEQLNQAIKVLMEDKIAAQQLAAKNEQRLKEVDQLHLQLKTAVKEVEKDERKSAEAADEAESDKEMQGLLNEMGVTGGTPKKEETKKKKKFLGIF